MEVTALKFLLTLLSQPGYRMLITEIKLVDPKVSAAERDRICRELCERQLVKCVEDILKLEISASGESLLRLDPIGVPMAPQELKALKTCQAKAKEITPKQTGLAPSEQDWVIPSLINRGLINATKKRIKDVWLTRQGKEYLAREYLPSGGSSISLTETQVISYLNFLRAYLVNH